MTDKLDPEEISAAIAEATDLMVALGKMPDYELLALISAVAMDFARVNAHFAGHTQPSRLAIGMALAGIDATMDQVREAADTSRYRDALTWALQKMLAIHTGAES